jgi:Kef-type K+ transport system membrane component KefB
VLVTQLLASESTPAAPGPVGLTGYVLADLVVILLAARLVGGLFVRLRQPRVAGEMIAGILIGPTVLGPHLAATVYPAEAENFITLFGTVALVIFVFLVGLEVPRRMFSAAGWQIGVIALAVTAASVAAGVVLSLLLAEPGVWRATVLADGQPSLDGAHALLLSAGIAATALPVLARILEEKGLITTPVGAVGIGVAAALTPVVFILLTTASNGSISAGPIVLRLVLAVVLAAVLFTLVRPLLARLLGRWYEPGAPLRGDLLAVLIGGALLSGLAAELIGINSLTGGLLFGIAVPQVDGLPAALVLRLRELVVVVGIPVFLAAAGLQTDLRTLRLDQLGGVILFLAAVVVSKWFVAATVGRATGLAWRPANAVGVLLACGGLVTLVVALVGKRAGLLTDSMYAVFAIAAILTTLATGPLLDRFARGPEAEADAAQPAPDTPST